LVNSICIIESDGAENDMPAVADEIDSRSNGATGDGILDHPPVASVGAVGGGDESASYGTSDHGVLLHDSSSAKNSSMKDEDFC
jgi:hypothetical protein